jgi:hypothetical protein
MRMLGKCCFGSGECRRLVSKPMAPNDALWVPEDVETSAADIEAVSRRKNDDAQFLVRKHQVPLLDRFQITLAMLHLAKVTVPFHYGVKIGSTRFGASTCRTTAPDGEEILPAFSCLRSHLGSWRR